MGIRNVDLQVGPTFNKSQVIWKQNTLQNHRKLRVVLVVFVTWLLRHRTSATIFSRLLPPIYFSEPATPKKTGWWFQNVFNVHPYLGKIPILTHIFQMGWFNHLPKTQRAQPLNAGFRVFCWNLLYRNRGYELEGAELKKWTDQLLKKTSKGKEVIMRRCCECLTDRLKNDRRGETQPISWSLS